MSALLMRWSAVVKVTESPRVWIAFEGKYLTREAACVEAITALQALAPETADDDPDWFVTGYETDSITRRVVYKVQVNDGTDRVSNYSAVVSPVY